MSSMSTCEANEARGGQRRDWSARREDAHYAERRSHRKSFHELLVIHTLLREREVETAGGGEEASGTARKGEDEATDMLSWRERDRGRVSQRELKKRGEVTHRKLRGDGLVVKRAESEVKNETKGRTLISLTFD